MNPPTFTFWRFTAGVFFACGLIGVSTAQQSAPDELGSTLSQVLNAVIGDSPTPSDKAALESEQQTLKQAMSVHSDVGAGNSTGSTVAAATRSNVVAPKGCQSTLRYLDAQLPKYTDPLLVNVRDQILNDSVVDDMRDAKAKGYDKRRAVSELLDSAASAERSSQEGKQCAIATSVQGESDALWKDWTSPSVRDLQCEGVLGSCKCAYVAGQYAAVAMRAMAAQVSTCWN